jgi:hypothetical protein
MIIDVVPAEPRPGVVEAAHRERRPHEPHRDLRRRPVILRVAQISLPAAGEFAQPDFHRPISGHLGSKYALRKVAHDMSFQGPDPERCGAPLSENEWPNSRPWSK